MLTKTLLHLVCLALAFSQNADSEMAIQAGELHSIVRNASRLPFEAKDIEVVPPQPGWEMGMVSWVAAGSEGLTYLLQRGPNADPVVVLDRDGRVVRSWGKGLYRTPHSIRVDPDGNVWTADAKSSMVIKYNSHGEKLMEISVGGQPEDCRGLFCGTSDVAFGPDGRVFVSDGYRNARILEYSANGKRVREWGSAGDGPGQFRLPHSIAVDDDVIYVADRENGRIQRFDLDGNFLGMWTQYGKTFGLHLEPGVVWLATQERNEGNASTVSGWLMKIDRRTGELLGYVNATGVHGMTVHADGELMMAPGPGNRPQRFTRKSDQKR